VALIVSVIALVQRKNRVEATVGLIMNVICLLVVFGLPLITALCR
jgi:hypothetical protein